MSGEKKGELERVKAALAQAGFDVDEDRDGFRGIIKLGFGYSVAVHVQPSGGGRCLRWWVRIAISNGRVGGTGVFCDGVGVSLDAALGEAASYGRQTICAEAPEGVVALTAAEAEAMRAAATRFAESAAVEVERAANIVRRLMADLLGREIERKAAGMKPGNPPEDGRKYRVVTDDGLETVVWYDNPGGFPFQNGVNSFETDEIPWHDPVPVEDEMSEAKELSNEIKALGLEHCQSEQEVLAQATAEAIAELTEEELREFVRELEGEVLSLRGRVALGNLRARGDLAFGLTALGSPGGPSSGPALAEGAPSGALSDGGHPVVREDALDED